MKQQIITLIGNIGSGKSSANSILPKALKAATIDADNLFQTDNPFREMYLQNMKRWALTNELWLTIKRVELLENKLAKLKKKIIFIDSGLLMSWVYTRSHVLVGTISKEEWKLYELVFEEYAVPLLKKTKAIYLKAPINILLKRIKQRGRDYELNYYTPKYLNQINEGLRALHTKLKKWGIKTTIVNYVNVKDFIQDQSERTKLIKITKDLI